MERGKYGYTPLHIAALYGQIAIATTLLLHGADIEAKADDGLTPLLAAATRGQKAMISLLLTKGADISATYCYGDSVFHLAAYKRDLDCFELLFNSGATPAVDRKNQLGQTPLCTVIAHKANSHLSDIDEQSTIAITELLLDGGASIQTVDDSNSYTLLHWASSYQQPRLVEYLLRRGADVDAKAQGRTVLCCLLDTWGNRQIIEILLRAGANVNASTNDGSTALHLVASRWYADMAGLSIDAGAYCVAKTHEGKTALNIAMDRHWRAQQRAESVALLTTCLPELRPKTALSVTPQER